jgi:hypothetical protein
VPRGGRALRYGAPLLNGSTRLGTRHAPALRGVKMCYCRLPIILRSTTSVGAPEWLMLPKLDSRHQTCLIQETLTLKEGATS